MTSNFCFQHEEVNTQICEPSLIYSTLILSTCDCLFLSIYFFLFDYVYPFNTFIWCSIPKLGLTVCFYFIESDRDHASIFVLSCFLNFIHCVINEELMLAVHRGQKGRTIELGLSVELPTSKYVAELRVEGEESICQYSLIEYYIELNLNFVY